MENFQRRNARHSVQPKQHLTLGDRFLFLPHRTPLHKRDKELVEFGQLLLVYEIGIFFCLTIRVQYANLYLENFQLTPPTNIPQALILLDNVPS